jgi:hypothetical protein
MTGAKEKIEKGLKTKGVRAQKQHPDVEVIGSIAYFCVSGLYQGYFGTLPAQKTAILQS